MGVGAGLYMCDVVKKFTFAISSPDEFLYSEPSVGSMDILYIGDSDEHVISSYHIYASCFPATMRVEQALRNVCYCDITFIVRMR